MSETKAAFAERTINKKFTVAWKTMGTNQFIFYRSLSQLWILERIVRLIWTEKVSKIPIFCPFFTANLYDSTGNQILKFDIEFPSPSMICLFEGVSYKSQFTQEIFAIAITKPPTYTIKDDQSEIIHGKFYQKELVEIILKWTCFQWSWYLIYLPSFFRQ